MPVCKFFSSKGGCARGDQCYFQHVQPASQERLGSPKSPPILIESCETTDGNSAEPAKARFSGLPDPLAEVDCRYFSLGTCKYGDKCRFRHTAMNEEEIAHESTSIPQQARSAASKSKSC